VVLDVTAENQSGERIFESSRIYMPQSTDGLGSVMALGPDRKLGLIRDTSIQPFATKEESFEIPMPSGVKKAKLTIQLSFQPRPGDVYPIHSVVKDIGIE